MLQAWGNIANLCILLFFLAVLGQTSAPYDSAKLSITWRIQYGFGTLIIFGMLYHRWFHLKESAVWEVGPSLWIQGLHTAAGSQSSRAQLVENN